MKDKYVRFSFYDVKIVPKDRSMDSVGGGINLHAIFSFYCATESEAKRKALNTMADPNNWKVDGCWRIGA